MLNERLTESPAWSVTMKFTAVVPNGKLSPELWELVMTKFTQLSDGVGFTQVTDAWQLAAA